MYFLVSLFFRLSFTIEVGRSLVRYHELIENDPKNSSDLNETNSINFSIS